MTERKKCSLKEDSDFVEVLSVAMNRIKYFNKYTEVNDDSNEVENRIEGDLIDGIELRALKREASSKCETKNEDRVNEISVFGSEKFLFGINNEPQRNEYYKKGKRKNVSGGNVEVIKVHGQ